MANLTINQLVGQMMESVILCGVELGCCLMNASGCHCTSIDDLHDLEKAHCGAIVSKSGTWEACSGNPFPRFKLIEHGSINAMGLPNPGFRFYTSYAKQRWNKSKPFIQSIYPNNLSELYQMLGHISENDGYALVELNLACPNVEGNGGIFGSDLSRFRHYLLVIRCSDPKLTVGLKLPPFTSSHDFDRISELLLEFCDVVKFITCTNSLPNGLVVDVETNQTVIHPQNGLGGIGGKYCKPIALANIFNFYTRLGRKIAIIGCGGVSTGQDAFEQILCGATAIQVGTQLLKRGPHCFTEIKQELVQIMKSKQYTTIDQFRGKLTIAPPIRSHL